MNVSTVQKAASQFGKGEPEIKNFGTGLINRTFKVNYGPERSVLLQCINQSTFSQPENIQHNYLLIADALKNSGGKPVPELLQTRQGRFFWRDEDDNFWRATAFVDNSWSKDSAGSAEEVKLAAKSFAEFSSSLVGLDPKKLEIIIPGFHDLAHRYNQFETAIRSATIMRLLKATHVISSLRERYYLVDVYTSIKEDRVNYPVRIMHHDCKISNILFRKESNEVICPVDLDTTMPGLFFSDLGDMIRTMACSENENSTAWENIDVVPARYDAIFEGYRQGLSGALTEAEHAKLHYSGLILTYMQCLRFVTDFLNNDIYYRTEYPEQNLNRALNQLVYLEKLEEYTGISA